MADVAAFKRAVEKFKRDWKAAMIFVDANMDAMSPGQQFGFAPETCLQMDHDAVHAEAAFRSATAAVYRGASGAPPAIPKFDRQKSGTAWSARAATAPAPFRCPPSNWTPSLQTPTNPSGPVYAHNVIHAGAPPPPPPAFLYRQVAHAVGGGGRGVSHGNHS